MSRPRRSGERVPYPRAAAYERWELPSVESTGPARVDQLKPAQDAAYREAYAAGRDKGYEDGFRRGREAGEQKLQEAVARFRALAAALAEPVRFLDGEVEQTLVALSMAVARQLVYGTLHHHPERVLEAVRQALSALPWTARNLRIHVNPRDAALVREAMPLGRNERPWTLLEDSSLARGGCRVESADSRIDAGVETRLKAVIARVLGREPVSTADEADEFAGGTEAARERIWRPFDSDE